MKISDLKWAALAVIVLASCSDKKSDGEIDNPEGPQGSGTMAVMTPEESKEFLQTTATDFLDKFKPEDQKAMIDLAGYYDTEFGDFEAPEEFEIKRDDARSRTPRNFLRALASAAQGDLDGLTRAAATYSYTIKFDQFAGVYEPSKKNEAWMKTGSSKDIIFKFMNRAGQQVELKVTQSGGVSDIDYSVTDTDWEWVDGEGYTEVEEVYNYYLSIPKTVTVTLTENGRQLAYTNMVSSIDVKGHTLSADINATLMNLGATAKVNGTDSKVEARMEFMVNNSKIASGYATLNGSNLCNIDKYEAMEDMDDDELDAELARMFSNADCGVDLLGEVQVYGQATYYKDMPEDMDGYFDYWDFDGDRNAAQKACQDACNRLNRYVKTQVRYNNTSTDQATLQFLPVFNPWYGGVDYWDYGIDAHILFPDGTSYDLESYFDKFTLVSNKWDTLIDAYETIWDQARRK